MEKEKRLVKLPSWGKAVFVGDTHGDVEASEKVLKTYLKPDWFIVFLGDYIDRGEYSRENIDLLLAAKQSFPDQVFLLMGNHEGQPILPFYPADFWESLDFEEKVKFEQIFRLLPLAAVTRNGILALHGVPPDIPSIERIEDVILGDERWQQITWGDFSEEEGDFLGNVWGRPLFGKDYFERVMRQLRFSVLIRAHQRYIPPTVFNGRCLTILTSRAYSSVRRIAIVDLSRPHIEDVRGIEVVQI